MRQAGLQVQRLEPPALSMVRALSRKHHWQRATWYAVINVGARVRTPEQQPPMGLGTTTRAEVKSQLEGSRPSVHRQAC